MLFRSILFEIAKQININRKDDLKQAKTLAQLLIKLGNCIGILEYDVEDYLKQGMELSELNINEKIRQRDAARYSKDFALSDQIRDELLALGIILEDSTNGTTWRRK